MEGAAQAGTTTAMNKATTVIQNLSETFGVSGDFEITSSSAEKKIVELRAIPDISNVSLSNAPDRGEGEITVSWKVNIKEQFHSLDAIGMFPVKVSGRLSRLKMDDCICYRLLEHTGPSSLGWRPKAIEKVNEQDDANDLGDSSEILVSAHKLARLTRIQSQKKAHMTDTTNSTGRVNQATLDELFEKRLETTKIKPGQKLTDTMQDAIDYMNSKEVRCLHENLTQVRYTDTVDACKPRKILMNMHNQPANEKKVRLIRNCLDIVFRANSI